MIVSIRIGHDNVIFVEMEVKINFSWQAFCFDCFENR